MTYWGLYFHWAVFWATAIAWFLPGFFWFTRLKWKIRLLTAFIPSALLMLTFGALISISFHLAGSDPARMADLAVQDPAGALSYYMETGFETVIGWGPALFARLLSLLIGQYVVFKIPTPRRKRERNV
ncbi:MAG: hypothetical protein AAGE61_21355 [Pseudomonadota bacterium]